MDFALNEEQEALRDLARKIFGDLASNDRLREVEALDPVFDETLWRELAKSHLLGLALPEAYGGSGFGFYELCLLLIEAGRAVAPVPLRACLAEGAAPLAHFGSDAQKAAWLPRIAKGEARIGAALAEPDSDDPRSPSTLCRADGTGFRLEGTKTNVAGGALLDAVLVPARDDDGGVHVFLVETTNDGLSQLPQQTGDRQPHAWLDLDGALVGEADRLGPPGAGATTLGWMVDHATVSYCAVQLGVSESSLERTAAYARERVQFGRPIGSFQAVHQRVADAYSQLEAMRLTFMQAAWRLSQGMEATRAIGAAKFWAAEGGQFIAFASQHLHGGIGIDVDYPLHRYFLWSMQNEHSLGSASAQLATLGREIADRKSP